MEEQVRRPGQPSCLGAGGASLLSKYLGKSYSQTPVLIPSKESREYVPKIFFVSVRLKFYVQNRGDLSRD